MKSTRLGQAGARVAAAACVVVGIGLLQAPSTTAGPGPASPPQACEPVDSGVAASCPSALMGDVGDAENPAIDLPDLSPDVTQVQVEHEWATLNDDGTWTYGPAWLNFDTVSKNVGRVPLELRAENVSLDQSAVSQCISWTTNFVCRQRTGVGNLEWHQAHLHFHFHEFASYELRRLLPSGEPDLNESGLLAASPKVSFCMEDTNRTSGESSPIPRYKGCLQVDQGISPGWEDLYDIGVDGQTLPLGSLGEGDYALVVTLNSQGRLYERTARNNRVIATVRISQLGTLFPAAEILAKNAG